MNGLAIRLLGSPHIELDGRPAALETRKAKGFGRIPEGWLQLQMQYDLAQISRRASDIQVTAFVASTAEPMTAVV